MLSIVVFLSGSLPHERVDGRRVQPAADALEAVGLPRPFGGEQRLPRGPETRQSPRRLLKVLCCVSGLVV